ncbi:unnamed protein product [Pieris macdunnoughi]|nr:unnamed protein product [Pieris macdunnoughi]
MDDPTLTLKTIKTKIKNLRSAYHTELKKIESSKRSGSGTATVYNPSATWFHELHAFLRDSGEYREPISMEVIQNAEDTSQDSQPDVSYPNSSTPQSVTLSSPSPSATVDNRPQSRSSNSSSTRSRKRRLQEEPISYALDRLENISAAINANNNEYDEFHYFAQNVAAQLRTLPLYEALDIQNEIQLILTAARRRHHYQNTQTITFIPPTGNTQTMISTPPTIDTNKFTYVLVINSLM